MNGATADSSIDGVRAALHSRGYDVLEQTGMTQNASVYTISSRAGSAKSLSVTIIPIQIATDQESINAAFRRELDLLKTLSHPSILAFCDGFLENGFIGLIFEHCEYGTLDQFIQDEDVSESLLLTLLRHAMAALDDCHRRGIAHGDIKPSNVLIDQARRPKISEFGFFALQSAICRPTTVTCRSFAAPELLNRSRNPDLFKADIWSLGATFYGLFVSQSDGERKIAVPTIDPATNKVRFPGKLNPGISGLLSKMLQLEPQQRPPLQELLALPVFGASVCVPKVDVRTPPPRKSSGDKVAVRSVIIAPKLSGSSSANKLAAIAPKTVELRGVGRSSPLRVINFGLT
jgi:serine/threonine protein kinase